ncbi:MAG: M14 family zinc carboxypeptidase [Stenotrophobium sp.]
MPAIESVVATAPMPMASVRRACELLGARLQSVSVEGCLKAGLKAGSIPSVNGQPLLYRDFLPQSAHAPPHRVLMLGGIHGDELSAVSLVFMWMQRLQTQRFQPFHWRVIPCLNPDGLLSDPPVRMNAHGVDLNRNFFTTSDWKRDALGYWRTKAHSDPRRFPGIAALSEPESRSLTETIRRFHPDIIISVHAPYDVLDFDGPRHPPRHFGFLDLHQLGTYPGSLGNYAGTILGLPVITLELPNARLMPTPAQIQRIWDDMLTWLDKNMPQHASPLYLRLNDKPWQE